MHKSLWKLEPPGFASRKCSLFLNVFHFALSSIFKYKTTLGTCFEARACEDVVRPSGELSPSCRVPRPPHRQQEGTLAIRLTARRAADPRTLTLTLIPKLWEKSCFLVSSKTKSRSLHAVPPLRRGPDAACLGNASGRQG